MHAARFSEPFATAAAAETRFLACEGDGFVRLSLREINYSLA